MAVISIASVGAVSIDGAAPITVSAAFKARPDLSDDFQKALEAWQASTAQQTAAILAATKAAGDAQVQAVFMSNDANAAANKAPLLSHIADLDKLLAAEKEGRAADKIAADDAATKAAADAKAASDTAAAKAVSDLEAAAADKASALAAAASDKAAALAEAAIKATADQTAAVKAATDPLNAKIADLLVQLAGTSGSRLVSLTAVQELALKLKSQETGLPVGAILNDVVQKTFSQIARTNTGPIMQKALAAWPIISEADRTACLTAMGLGYLASLTPAQQIEVMAPTVADRFAALEPSVQNLILAKLGV